MTLQLEIESPHRHLVDFYESDEDLVARVAAYLAEGVQRGEVAIVIATEAHRRMINEALGAAELDVRAALGDGSLAELDAAELLDSFYVGGGVDVLRFDDTVGELLRSVVGRTGIRAYGEMVQLLWERGDVNGAVSLEAQWNALGRECDFLLYCGYQASGAEDHPEALEEVRRLHSEVVSEPARMLEAHAHFPVEHASIRSARRFVASVLERWDLHYIDDLALLVVSELSTNALVHAKSPFTVGLSRTDAHLRVSVSDASPSLPTLRRAAPHAHSGRGLTLVGQLSAAWGATPTDSGKTVWAEFAILGSLV